MRKKILVTGSKGQLGKKIIDLMSDEFDLILTDSDNMDITDKGMISLFFNKYKPDYIIHAAAYTQVDKAEDNVAICSKVNIDGTRNMALACKKIGAVLIYISTDYVFDGKKISPYEENDKPSPLSVYGDTKFEGENCVKDICEKYFIIRSSWVFGELPENHSGTNFVETIIRLSKEKSELTIVNDQIGSPTYTKDLVEIIKEMINKSPAYGIYHFSSTGACSWYDFAKEILAQTNTAIELKPITSSEYPQKAKRPSYSYMDKSKIEKALRIKVRSWQEMLSEYLRINK